MRRNGFSLLEVSMSMAILSVVSLLGFVVLKSSTEAAALSGAKAEVQANLRDAMTALTAELREAYTDRTVLAVPPIAPAETMSVQATEGGLGVMYQIPEPTGGPDMVTSSLPVFILWENEDTYGPDGGFNARLDEGEDGNGDGTLTRRLIRSQGDEETIIGGANNLSGVQFQLLPNQDSGDNTLTSIRIWLEASKRYGPGDGKLVRAELEATIHMAN